MSLVALQSLVQVFSEVPDPRDPRGTRHPSQSILALVFLGLLARIREMAVLQRWAKVHWAVLREPLGFERDTPPHATTISRVVASCSLARFTTAFLAWTKTMTPDVPLSVAVDAKTSCQGLDDQGDPIQLVTVLVHELKLVLAQWSVHGEKTNEPRVLMNHLEELIASFPLLKLVTGDAIYTQRPLVEVLQDQGVDYLLQIKGNQGDMQDAAQHCLGDAHERAPAAKTVEKRGLLLIGGNCGLTWITPHTFATR